MAPDRSVRCGRNDRRRLEIVLMVCNDQRRAAASGTSPRAHAIRNVIPDVVDVTAPNRSGHRPQRRERSVPTRNTESEARAKLNPGEPKDGLITGARSAKESDQPPADERRHDVGQTVATPQRPRSRPMSRNFGIAVHCERPAARHHAAETDAEHYGKWNIHASPARARSRLSRMPLNDRESRDDFARHAIREHTQVNAGDYGAGDVEKA